jgi:hypothetical protein
MIFGDQELMLYLAGLIVLVSLVILVVRALIEREHLREVFHRAKFLSNYYGIVPDGTEWESMTPQEAYKYGQAFAAHYIAYGDQMLGAQEND